jgi:hypothetical protein
MAFTLFHSGTQLSGRFTNALLAVLLWVLVSPQTLAETRVCDADAKETVRKKYGVGTFNKIDIRGNFLLELSQGPEYSLEIEALPETLSEIYFRSNNDRLRMHAGDCRSSRFIVRLTMPEIVELDLEGEFNIITKTPLTSPRIKIDVSTFARGKMTFDSKWVDVNMTGNSILEFFGQTNHLALSVLGNGSLDATNMLAQTAIVNAWGNGIETVRVSDFLKVIAQGNALIQYYGDPVVESQIRNNAYIRAIETRHTSFPSADREVSAPDAGSPTNTSP